jgi:hypothetical protein
MTVSTPATAETIRVTGMLPGATSEAPLLRTIAVARFGGPDGDAVAGAIGARLAQADDEPRPFFDLVARPAAAEGVIDGQASVDISESSYTETRKRCAEKVKKECVRHERYVVECLRRSVALHGDWRLVRRRDDRVLFARPIAQEASDEACEDSGTLADVGSTVDRMLTAIATHVRVDIAPHRESWTPRIREGRDGMSKADAAAFKAAVAWTKSDVRAACDAFAAIEARAPHPSTRFNVALCAESRGDFAQAQAGYASVATWIPGDADDAQKALRRVERLVAGERQMADVLRVRSEARF